MELILSQLHNEYIEAILLKEKTKKEAIHYQQTYYDVFSKYILEAFQLKYECILLKKRITYCQLCVNHNKTIYQNDINNYISLIENEYLQETKELKQKIKASKNKKLISSQDVKEIKQIYHRIVKKIHPDIHPELFQKQQIQELWQRTSIAYTCNHKEELIEIEALLDTLLLSPNKHIKINNIEEAILKIQEETNELKRQKPYIYKYILETEDCIKEHKNKLITEINTYIKYKTQLQDIYTQFNIKGVDYNVS